MPRLQLTYMVHGSPHPWATIRTNHRLYLKLETKKQKNASNDYNTILNSKPWNIGTSSEEILQWWRHIVTTYGGEQLGWNYQEVDDKLFLLTTGLDI